MNDNSAVCIHAIVVSFEPNLDVLLRQIELVAPQVRKIWLVDNASSTSLALWVSSLGLQDKLELVQLPTNLGLGTGQNRGIQLARAAGGTHILILDQDSQPMSNMVKRLLAASDQLQAAGVPLAAVAPMYSDSINGTSSGFVRLGWLDYIKSRDNPDHGLVMADFFISSGSLILVSALDDIGPMDESLFIDHVDTEWCLRAKSKGYKLFGVPEARMVHSLGDARARIWFLRWRNVSFHSPFRYYYILRNGLLLQKRSYIPLKWKTAELYRCFRMLAFYGLFGKYAWARRQMMRRGLIDGWRGVSGPMS